MRSLKDVEAYLGRLNRRFNAVEGQPGTFILDAAPGNPPVALRVDPPLVVIRVRIGDAPKDDHAPLFRKLLALNAKELVHTSFGLEEDRIVLSSALELENLDFNELEATLDEIDMVLAQRVGELRELSKAEKG